MNIKHPLHSVSRRLEADLCSRPKPPQTPPVLGDFCGSAQRMLGSPLLCPPRLRRALTVKGNAEWQSVNGSLKSWCLIFYTSELTVLTSAGPQHNLVTPHYLLIHYKLPKFSSPVLQISSPTFIHSKWWNQSSWVNWQSIQPVHFFQNSPESNSFVLY